MSIEAMNLVLNHSKATGRAKLVLLGIANHFGDNGAWPSIETLARYANASERSVKRDIQELVDLGELTVDVNAAPMKSQYKTNLYWINVEAGVTTQVSRGDSSGKSGVTPVGTQTIIKNHKESDTRPTRISEDFSVSREMRNWAALNHPDVDIDKATLNFVDYWLTKPKNNTKLDWNRTWQTWIRNTRPEIKKGNRVAENKSVLDEFRKRYGSN
jgi:DNA-binding Lrp family transcriptional regulator